MDQPALRRSVLRYTLLLILIQGALALFLARWPGPGRLGWSYLVGAMVWTCLTAWIMLRNVHLLYTIEGSPVRRLNLATRVTLIRVLAVPLVVSLVMVRELRAAGIVFLGAAATDWLDGFLARRMHDVTQLGRIADPGIDALICGVTILALEGSGLLPTPVFVLVLVRYGILFGGAALLRFLAGYLPVRATFAGRFLYFVQYSLLVAILILGGRGAALPWLVWALGVVQAAVIVQLLVLGVQLYREASREA